MAVPDAAQQQDPDADFISRSYLTYVIPSRTKLDLEQVLGQEDEQTRTTIDSLEQRESLVFDETVDLYVALRSPYRPEKAFRSLLSRLTISVEASVVNSHAAGRGSPPSSEVMYEGDVEDATDPFIFTDGRPRTGDGSVDEDADPAGRDLYAVWKVPIFLARPRIRLQGPSAVFSASASLRCADADGSNGADASRPRRGGYLESMVPPGLNLLQAFAGDPSLGGIEPRLSALRVSSVTPATQSRNQPRPLKALHSLSFKVFPVAHTRVRFARPNTMPSSPALLALLEVDFTPFFDCEMVLEEIDLKITDGTIQNLNSPAGIGLPMTCVAHDHVTFLYRLAPDQLLDLDVESRTTAATTRDLDIAIRVSALAKPGVCTPTLKMAWTTTLDFTLPLNPGFGTHGLTPAIQRAHRPSQLSISGTTDTQSLVASPISRPDALPSLEAATRAPETTIPDFGITMTMTGPEQPVYVGEEFRWTVFVVNRSPTTAPALGATAPTVTSTSTSTSTSGPAAALTTATATATATTQQARKLALIAIPKRRRNEVRVLRPPSTAAPVAAAAAAAGSTKHGRLPPVADAVLDDNIVHAVQRSSLVDATELVCLSADVRVGPLAPGACAVVDLRFLALQEGVVGVECLRVVDLGTQEHVDVRELPLVLVTRRE